MQNSVTTHEIKDGVITTKTVFSINGKEEVLISTSPIKEEPRKPVALKIDPDALKHFSVKLKHLRVHQETVAAARLALEHGLDGKKRHQEDDAELSKSSSLTSNITIYPADGNGETIYTSVAWIEDNKNKLSLSKIENFNFRPKQNQTFEEIHIKNNYFTGKAKLYKDNAHIANIVFIL